MLIERILLESELKYFYKEIEKHLIFEGLKPKKKHLEIFYHYVRLNESLNLDNPRKAFYEVLNEKDNLLFFETNSFEEVSKEYGFSGKIDFIKIKLLEIEIYLKKHNLYLSHLGKNF
jgi:hypothetical protein